MTEYWFMVAVAELVDSFCQ